ncbi:hypothetical protein GcC1_030039, partial [Golovinomyces cichoracearum]
CGVAQDKLREAGIDTLWASKSIFINEDDLNKHVTPHHGGRVISIGDGLREIKKRNNLTDAMTELEVAQQRLTTAKEAEQK